MLLFARLRRLRFVSKRNLDLLEVCRMVFQKIIKNEGAAGLYKGLVPLWGRQIPYTMMKFASFETIVEMMYKHAIPTPKEQCSPSFQLGVSFAGGYLAGILCAIVSHPADNLVSFLNNAEGATVGDAVKKLGLWGLFTRGAASSYNHDWKSYWSTMGHL
ncbi:putative mitochondrial carrier domain superfamily [Helianthus annuus]|nr:putative mitochondrial carrier domain superfamily [Helianthus annuus]